MLRNKPQKDKQEDETRRESKKSSDAVGANLAKAKPAETRREQIKYYGDKLSRAKDRPGKTTQDNTKLKAKRQTTDSNMKSNSLVFFRNKIR